MNFRLQTPHSCIYTSIRFSKKKKKTSIHMATLEFHIQQLTYWKFSLQFLATFFIETRIKIQPHFPLKCVLKFNHILHCSSLKKKSAIYPPSCNHFIHLNSIWKFSHQYVLRSPQNSHCYHWKFSHIIHWNFNHTLHWNTLKFNHVLYCLS